MLSCIPENMHAPVSSVIRSVLGLNTTKLSKEELEKTALVAFRAAKGCDVDNSGTMSTSEITELCRRMGLPVADGDDAIESMDQDGSGVLDIVEFLQWWIKRAAAVPGTYIHAKKMAVIDFTDEQKDIIKSAVDTALADPKNLSSDAELTQQASAAYRAAKATDLDGNDIITTSEIEELCEKMGLPLSDGAEETLYSMDEDGSGRLEIMEFVVWWIKRVSRLPGTHKQQEVIARNAFKNFDVDKSGTITANELADIVATLGVNFSESELEEALNELDTDHSGYIDQNEFLEWWMNRAQSVRPGASLIAYKLKKLANKAAQVFYTDIHTAAWKGDLELVKMFLDATPLLCNAGDTNEHGDGWTPLQYACYQGHTDIVVEILSRKNEKKAFLANVNLTNDLGFTALFYAAQRQHVEICRLLIEKGADPTLCGTHQIDPDIRMCAVDHVQDCEELREIFAVHQDCIPPTAPSANDIRASINAAGVVAVEFPEPRTVVQLSKIPLTKWRVRLSSGQKGAAPLEVLVSASRAKTDQRQRCELELEEKVHNIFVEAAKNGTFSANVSCMNAMGESNFGSSVRVSYNGTAPKRKISSGGAGINNSATDADRGREEKN
jgi:Ca2+-binding EF-hand superfamily protein